MQKRVKWTCPHCNHLHFWYWDTDDVFEGETNMNCDDCGKHSKHWMHIDPLNGNAWCEFIGDSDFRVTSKWLRYRVTTENSEIENLKRQAQEIQQRIKELEEKKKNQKLSLHNLIAKWEYNLSERLEFQKNSQASKNQKVASCRDILIEEMENLMVQIDEWLPEMKSIKDFDKNDRYKNHEALGYNMAIIEIRNRLRSEHDMYARKK
jgi:hypothetical protein